MSANSTMNNRNTYIMYDDPTQTDLHKAVKSRNVETLKHLLENRMYNVNEKDKNGNTPLLLVMEIEDELLYESILDILIKFKANINVKNNVGWTLLYAAVFNQNVKCVKILLKLGADPNDSRLLNILTDKPNGNGEILKLLVEDPKFNKNLINKTDDKGRTPLYRSALFGFQDCLKLLIENGGDLTFTYEDFSVIDKIFEEIINPVGFLLEILNFCVHYEKIDDGCKNSYIIDFSVLAPDSSERQMDVISNLLVAASDEEKTELLQHPVIELYLMRKWRRISHFFYMWIIGYVIFVISMSVYTILLTRDYPGFGHVLTTSRCVLIVSGTGLFVHALIQCALSSRRRFRKYEMWLNLTCTSLSLIVALTGKPWFDDNAYNINNMPNWVLHVTSVAVLLAWTELMLIVGRLPTYGYYALMFSAVLQNVINVISAFICLVIGFALSFSIQFHGYHQFGDPWRALVKTIVMMMGEFEYADLFAEKSDDGDSLKKLPPTSRVIFLMFIILTSIVLMNLMVGLAVSDIQSLQKVSHAKKLEKQAEFLTELEKVLSSRRLKSKYVFTFIRRIFQSHKIKTSYVLKTSAKFRRSKKLSHTLIDSLVVIAKAQEKLIRIQS